MAVRGTNGEGLAIAVEEGLHPPQRRHPGAVAGRERAHLEHVVGADADAVFLGLALVAIDHRRETAGGLLAIVVSRYDVPPVACGARGMPARWWRNSDSAL